jgi:hypothetical protein
MRWKISRDKCWNECFCENFYPKQKISQLKFHENEEERQKFCVDNVQRSNAYVSWKNRVLWKRETEEEESGIN